MKIAIFGAGSVGCWIGGAWAAAGLDVRLIGREHVCREIETNGLSVSAVGGWTAHLRPGRIDCRDGAGALAEADLILLTVKTPATETAAAEIGRYARPTATLITFQNGVGSAELLRRLLPELDVVQGTVAYNIVRRGPGRWHKATGGDLIARHTSVTEALATAIGDRPGRMLLSDDMTGVTWGKLLLNLNNAVNALSGLTLLEQLRQRDYRRVVAAAMREALALLDAAGIPPATTGPVPPRWLPRVIGAHDLLFNSIFLPVQKIDANARSSMADDLTAGRRTEIDDLNGEVVRLATRLGRDAPVNAAMVALVKAAEQGGQQTWTAKALRDRVLSRG